MIKRQAIETKSSIRKNTACTVFLDTITIIAEIIAIKEKK
tara:strand:+ start:327 stop:446 length:120 start_codon:yes stop_codon:yes gene_type:complete